MAINITQLYQYYQGKSVLNGIDLNIKKGSIFGLLGLNGAGKTTLVSILNFLIKPHKGNIHILNYDAQYNASKIKSLSGFVPQSFAFYPNLTGHENLQFFGALYGLKGRHLQHKIAEVSTLVAMNNEIHTKARYYSGGYQRRLNLAIGLLNNPKILYLDEPTVGVDAHTRKKILHTIQQINEQHGTTIVYTSHYMEEIQYICDDIAILNHGSIVLHEKKTTLNKSNQSLEKIFMDLTKKDFIS